MRLACRTCTLEFGDIAVGDDAQHFIPGCRSTRIVIRGVWAQNPQQAKSHDYQSLDWASLRHSLC
jgi:hypothetical protein